MFFFNTLDGIYQDMAPLPTGSLAAMMLGLLLPWFQVTLCAKWFKQCSVCVKHVGCLLHSASWMDVLIYIYIYLYPFLLLVLLLRSVEPSKKGYLTRLNPKSRWGFIHNPSIILQQTSEIARRRFDRNIGMFLQNFWVNAHTTQCSESPPK